MCVISLFSVLYMKHGIILPRIKKKVIAILVILVLFFISHICFRILNLCIAVLSQKQVVKKNLIKANLYLAILTFLIHFFKSEF